MFFLLSVLPPSIHCIQKGISSTASMLFRFIIFFLFAGSKCSRRIKNIPFKPLSVRMLEEPFWLGLIAVTVVLSIIGICYLLKEHLPERFDKYLNSEIILKDKHLLGGTADTSHGGGGIYKKYPLPFYRTLAKCHLSYTYNVISLALVFIQRRYNRCSGNSTAMISHIIGIFFFHPFAFHLLPLASCLVAQL